MDNGIYAVFYDLPEAGRKEYLNWFHEVHIPKALSRPGYLWAAHYEAAFPGERFQNIIKALPRSKGPGLASGTGYLALLGGESTCTFFDPSPSQLMEHIDAESSEMIARRINPLEYIFAVEWRTDAPDSHRRDSRGTLGPIIQMGRFDVLGHDDELEAWYSQERMKLLSRTPGAMGGRKLLVAAGAQRHAVLYEFISLEARAAHFVSIEETEATRRMHSFSVHPPGSPFVGKRIWPPV